MTSAILAEPAATAAMPDLAIEIRDLRKVYRATGRAPEKVALHGVSLNIPRGQVYGLLGPNGAGKSTLINIMAGLVTKTAGAVRIWHSDIDANARQARASIGIVPQELNLDAFFTPRELLDLQAGLYGVPPGERQTAALLATVGLADKAEAYSRTLSGGMRRRLMVAKAMAHMPPILVLDEPTAGVDIELRQGMWSTVRQLNRAGVTVLLTTHYLEEAQELCDRIAIINHGRVVADESTANLLAMLDSKTMVLRLDRALAALPDGLGEALGELSGQGDVLTVRYPPTRVPAGAIVAAVQASGAQILDITTEQGDLEDVFLSLTRAGKAG